MGIPLPQGVNGDVPPPVGDVANEVMAIALSGIGTSPAVNMYGAFNAVAYASFNTILTTTAGSAAFSVAAAGAIAVGSSVFGQNIPPGTTVKTFAGTAGTLSFPIVGLECTYQAGVAQLRNLPQTNFLLGATVTGPGIPPGTTITAITQAFQQGPGTARTEGIATISAAPTANSAPRGVPLGGNGRNRCLFALTASGVLGGADAAALFTGPSIVFVGTVELERSFDGGNTWVTCNIGGGGSLAQYNAGTPVSFIAGECERGVAYRWNCIAYTSGIINLRLSTTGQAATTIGLNATV